MQMAYVYKDINLKEVVFFRLFANILSPFCQYSEHVNQWVPETRNMNAGCTQTLPDFLLATEEVMSLSRPATYNFRKSSQVTWTQQTHACVTAWK
jgi:hypothetical protein